MSSAPLGRRAAKEEGISRTLAEERCSLISRAENEILEVTLKIRSFLRLANIYNTQYNAMQYKTMQGTARQDKAKQDKTNPDKEQQGQIRRANGPLACVIIRSLLVPCPKCRYFVRTGDPPAM